MKTALEFSPVCPLNLVAESDAINLTLCDYEHRTNTCLMGCKRKGKSFATLEELWGKLKPPASI